MKAENTISERKKVEMKPGKGRILIAGTGSGCGKTTVVLALLAALKKRWSDAKHPPLSAFKCGPDYIDPMFHRQILGISSRNLDPYFCHESFLQAQLWAEKDRLSVIEGVMGFYDGIGTEGMASTWEVAKKTATPAILVVNPKGMYTSAGAILKGFREFREESGIQGVIFNAISPHLYDGLKSIAKAQGLIPLGFLPSNEEIRIGSRHLGLVTAGEIRDLQEKLEKLGQMAETCLDLNGILTLAAKAKALSPSPSVSFMRDSAIDSTPETDSKIHKIWRKPVIAVARDSAFCFLYQENLEMLESLGCNLQFFSPLKEEALPEGSAGLYLPGGYPELYAKELSQNKKMLYAIHQAVTSGVPTIAECGGFLYLHDFLDGFEMAGVISGTACQTERLQRFGYIQLTAKKDNLLCKNGESIRAHEFHYWDSANPGEDFMAEKPSGNKRYSCIHASHSFYAGFPHLYFPANPSFAERFVTKAAAFEGMSVSKNLNFNGGFKK